MPKCQFLFSAVFGSRKALRAIFLEFDETKTQYLIFPGRPQNTEGESEAGTWGRHTIGWRGPRPGRAALGCGPLVAPLRLLFGLLEAS